MTLSWRPATEADLSLLAEWNHQLIRDEGHRNPMTVDQLAERMRKWLEGEYRAAFEILRREIWSAGVRLTVDVLCRNAGGVAFWRRMGYQDYCLTLEIMPEPARKHG